MSIILFFFLCIQQSIFSAPDFKYVINYIYQENSQANKRQQAYRMELYQEKVRIKKEIEQNFFESKERYNKMQKKFYSRWEGVAFKKKKVRINEKDFDSLIPESKNGRFDTDEFLHHCLY